MCLVFRCSIQRGTNDDTVPGMSVESGGTWICILCMSCHSANENTAALLCTYLDGWYYIPVSNIQEQFAVHNGCDLSGGIEQIETVSDGIRGWRCVGWTDGCSNNASTISCQWDGAHESPVNTYTESNFGLEAAWNFMSRHQRDTSGEPKLDGSQQFIP